MFHGTIVFGGKGPTVFWENEWGSMDSEKYDVDIVNDIESFLQVDPDHGFTWMQDNASCHPSKQTQKNLRLHQIPMFGGLILS
jgi:hypothetical protein